MLLTFLLQAGIIEVLPINIGFIIGFIITSIVIFVICYAIQWKKLRAISYWDTGRSFADTCKGHIMINVASDKIRSSRFGRTFFMKRYKALQDSSYTKLIRELDRLDQYSPDMNSNVFNHSSFRGQWEHVCDFIYKNHFWSDQTEPYKMKDEWKQTTLNLMLNQSGRVIANRMYSLYKKQSLLFLRTKGYSFFSLFLERNAALAEMHPSADPLSELSQMNKKILDDFDKEVSDYLKNEVKSIQANRKNLKEQLEKLLDSYVVQHFYWNTELGEIKKLIVNSLNILTKK